MIIDNYYYHFVSITIMNSIFVIIYFFEWRWRIDFLAKLVLTSCYFSLVFLSIRSKLKSEIKKMWSIGTLILKVSRKDKKVGRTQIWGYLEFMCYIIVWNIWKLTEKFLLCAFGFANLDICWSRLMGIHTSLLHSSNYFSEKQQQQI